MNAVGDLNLWALGYEDVARAKEVRAALRDVENLYGLHVLDAVAVRRLPDGSFALERDESPSVSSGVLKSGLLGVLLGLVVLEPLGAAAVAVALGGLLFGSAKQLGIDEGFVRDVEDLMKPGSSALFLLTRTDNPDAVSRDIRGLGGVVLKTNVNADLARRVQESLAAPRPTA